MPLALPLEPHGGCLHAWFLNPVHSLPRALLPICSPPHSICYTFFDPSLEIELNSRLHVTDIQKGILFGLPALPYALGSPIAGRLSDSLGCKVLLIHHHFRRFCLSVP